MRITDLNRDQLVHVKELYLAEREQRTGISWAELVNADSIVSDEEIFHEYENMEFSEDDFDKPAEEGMSNE